MEMPGLLALVGGDEFNPGNEEQDRMLATAAGRGEAFVVPTAAARQKPDQSVAHAIRWFRKLGLELRELPVLKRADAMSAAIASRARGRLVTADYGGTSIGLSCPRPSN